MVNGVEGSTEVDHNHQRHLAAVDSAYEVIVDSQQSRLCRIKRPVCRLMSRQQIVAGRVDIEMTGNHAFDELREVWQIGF
jgi:hypothetical protein